MTDEQAGHRSHIITLLTDFGHTDVYVGVMKGVILGICARATLVDLTHMVPPQDVVAGMERLAEAWPYFPHGTVHLAVVDPGVGSSRAPLVIEANGHLFVGPDNGIFTSVLQRFPLARVHRLEASEYRLPVVSATFHGRDVFAPAAAWLAMGVQPQMLGPRHADPVLLARAVSTPLDGGGHLGHLTASDGFGNLGSTLEAPLGLSEGWRVRFRTLTLPLLRTYSDVDRGTLMALVGSSGRIELAVNGGSAQALLGAARGEPIRLEPLR